MRAQSIQARWRTSVSSCDDSIDDRTALSSDTEKKGLNRGKLTLIICIHRAQCNVLPGWKIS